MKKKYMIPEMEVIKIETHQMLAASPNSVYDQTGGGTQLGRELDDYDF